MSNRQTIRLEYNENKLLAGYVFPIENQTAVQDWLHRLQAAKDEYDKFVAQVYYKEFPKLR